MSAVGESISDQRRGQADLVPSIMEPFPTRHLSRGWIFHSCTLDTANHNTSILLMVLQRPTVSNFDPTSPSPKQTLPRFLFSIWRSVRLFFCPLQYVNCPWTSSSFHLSYYSPLGFTYPTSDPSKIISQKEMFSIPRTPYRYRSINKSIVRLEGIYRLFSKYFTNEILIIKMSNCVWFGLDMLPWLMW